MAGSGTCGGVRTARRAAQWACSAGGAPGSFSPVVRDDRRNSIATLGAEPLTRDLCSSIVIDPQEDSVCGDNESPAILRQQIGSRQNAEVERAGNLKALGVHKEILTAPVHERAQCLAIRLPSLNPTIKCRQSLDLFCGTKTSFLLAIQQADSTDNDDSKN